MSSTPLFLLPWPSPLVEGRLLRRYHRFLADVELADGRVVTAHCVNTGSMEGMVRKGALVWLTHAPDPAKKLQFTWQATDVEGVLVGSNTAMPNRIVKGMLESRLLPGFEKWTELKPERPYGENSRVDFWLRVGRREHYLEVKNCHLVYPDGRGYFPDSVSTRATGHLHELSLLAREGHGATVLFTAQRADCRAMRPSDLHDPAFAAAAREAKAAGVKFRALRIEPTAEGLVVHEVIPVDLKPYALPRMQRWRAELAAHSGWERPKRAAADE